MPPENSFAGIHTLLCIGDLLPVTPAPELSVQHWGHILHALLIAADPKTRYQFVDQCAPAQRLHHLRERWADDVLWYRPDTVVVMCGVSDGYYILQDGPEKMDPAQWGAALRRLIARHREQLPDSRLVFLEPFLHTLSDIPEAVALRDYQKVLRDVCVETGCIWVGLAEKLQERIQRCGEWTLGTSLEPNLDAQVLIADAALAALTPTAPRPSPPVDGLLTLCIGDSITDADRRDARWAPLGRGYVRIADALWQARSCQVPLVRNEGVGGNTVVDIQRRWERDALVHKPARLTLKVGINDVNQTLSNGPEPVPPALYRDTLFELLSRTRSSLPDCTLYLIQPFFLSRMEDPESYRTKVLNALAGYHELVREAGAAFGCKILETHALFQRHLDVYHQSELSFEPVHINLIGHIIVAEAVLGLLQNR